MWVRVHEDLLRSKECWVTKLGFWPPGEGNSASNVSSLSQDNRQHILASASAKFEKQRLVQRSLTRGNVIFVGDYFKRQCPGCCEHHP